ncbi:MAG: aminotransferase class V-fold PLP-dependent enzyme [Thermoanaerobaculales bacterium]|nr:aminotransferase class V-fold PLP-dependent enzyme [Thermoanaerobaculales bacterium]
MTAEKSKLVYLDHGATSFPKAPGVAKAVGHFLDEIAGNPGRGGHRLTISASRAIEESREAVATLLGSDPERTLLGPGATFWLNTILESTLKPGDRVVLSALEHNAVMRPLRLLESRLRLNLHIVEGQPDTGVPTVREIADAVRSAPTAMVVLTQASNVSGAVLPVEEIARTVAPVSVVVDGAQGAGSLAFDFQGSGISAYACSGHKGLLGPPGTGVLLLAPGFSVQPLIRGGTGSNSESEEMPSFLPDSLEAGTPNGAGIAGLGAACKWLEERGVEAIHLLQNELVQRLADNLRTIKGVDLHGFRDDAHKTGILSFTVRDRDVGELATLLDRECNIALRAGLHCSPAAHRRLGTFPAGTLRAGLGPFNTAHDVDVLVNAIREICRMTE